MSKTEEPVQTAHGVRITLTDAGKRLAELMKRYPRLAAVVSATNPDFKITEVVNIAPITVEAERIGATAGRIYLREQNRLYVVTMSDMAFARLEQAMEDEALA